MDSDSPSPKPDVVFVQGAAEQGEGLKVIRRRDETLEVGEIRPIQEGRPIHGEVVKLKPRKEHERLFDVEVVVPRADASTTALTHGGPAQVATDRYRTNWESIFGSADDTALPN